MHVALTVRDAHVQVPRGGSVEEAARIAFPDVAFRLELRRGLRDTDRIETELRSQPADVVYGHARIVPT